MLRNTDESLARALTRKAAQLTLVGALAAAPLALTAGTASAATDWDALAECESGGDWGINTGNGYQGGLQFSASTWRAFGGSGQASDASREEQIRVAERVKAGQGMNAWPTCSKKTGNTSNSPNSGGSGSSSSSESRSSSSSSDDDSRESETRTVRSSERSSATAPAGASYTVVSGDTLSAIAAANGTTWRALADVNSLSDPDSISVGQKLAMS